MKFAKNSATFRRN